MRFGKFSEKRELTFSLKNEEYLKSVLDNYHIGGVRYNPGKAEEVYEQNKILQENSKIPLLIAANTEAGGNGACVDGTYVGYEVKIGSTNDKKYAYEMGRVSGVEASAIGCNWSFAPIVDIDYNFLNPITNIRTYGSNQETIIKFADCQIEALKENHILPCIKHFPGDGVDMRDQHLLSSVNDLTVNKWNNS